MNKLTKQELEVILNDTYKKIEEIDYNTIYSYFYCYNKDTDNIRTQLIELAKKIHTEIIYKTDDEKRSNYNKIRELDPMKNSTEKIYTEDTTHK
jgi:hypothetical protein